MTLKIYSYSNILAAAAEAGLAARGGLLTEPGDALPEGFSWLLLLGWVGSRNWGAFAEGPEASDGAPDPLDRWSKRTIDALAADLGAIAFYPFGGPPYRPFLAWARRAEGLRSPSPLGMLIHPQHGLWHAYRGAMAFAYVPDGWEAPTAAPIPCNGCARPCLQTCPVRAFGADGYNAAACRRHLMSPAGQACMEGGCLARRACPVAPHLSYAAAQTQFHMQAFRDAGAAATAGSAGT